jgi:hypothetical protein
MRDPDNRSHDRREEEALPMLPRSTQANEQLPSNGQVVQVRVGNGEWQHATFRDGEFIDAYGMPLDRRRITGWRPLHGSAGNQS